MRIDQSAFTTPGHQVREAGEHARFIARALWSAERRRDAVRMWLLGTWLVTIARLRGW